jgi:tartrate dehydratase alpha subunit/fumarate hydratase class I-like protein
MPLMWAVVLQGAGCANVQRKKALLEEEGVQFEGVKVCVHDMRLCMTTFVCVCYSVCL